MSFQGIQTINDLKIFWMSLRKSWLSLNAKEDKWIFTAGWRILWQPYFYNFSLQASWIRGFLMVIFFLFLTCQEYADFYWPISSSPAGPEWTVRLFNQCLLVAIWMGLRNPTWVQMSQNSIEWVFRSSTEDWMSHKSIESQNMSLNSSILSFEY